MNNTWRPEDIQRLREMASQNVSVLRAAAALNRSTGSIRIQARKLGLDFPTLSAMRKKLNAAAPLGTGRRGWN
jgi:hypothetical protein